MNNLEKQYREVCKFDSFDIERHREHFVRILVDLNNFLNEALGDVDHSVDPYEMLGILKRFMLGKVRFEGRLIKRMDQFEIKLEKLDSD